MTLYGHLDQAHVHLGDVVKGNQVIGTAGLSGNAKGHGPQVHFEVWNRAYMAAGSKSGALDFNEGHKNLVDPYDWLQQSMRPPEPRPKPTFSQP